MGYGSTENYAKRFAVACNKGLFANEGLSEVFMRNASDSEMSIHFEMSFPDMAAKMANTAPKERDYVQIAEMYARVFSRFLNYEQYDAMSRGSQTAGMIGELKKRNAPYFAAYLEAGLRR